MTDNRNTILAVILSGLVLIAWQYFYNVPQMERQRAQTQTQTELAKPDAADRAGLHHPGARCSTPSATTPAASRATAAARRQPRRRDRRRRPASRSRRRGFPAASR